MKRSAFALPALLTLSLASLFPTLAQAEDTNPLSFNVGAVSDYRYRGLSQSRLDPAVQGGADYAPGPFYVGTWLSTIKWVKDAGWGDSPAEWDLYGGLKGDLVKDSLSYDVGVLAYVYLGEKAPYSPDTGEFYGALTYGPVTGKVSVSATNLFGFADSKGSQYYDLSANFDVGAGFTLTPHVGYQNITGSANKAASYTDYSLTLGKDFGKGLSASLAVLGTDADKTLYFTPSGKFTGRTGAVLGVKYTF